MRKRNPFESGRVWRPDGLAAGVTAGGLVFTRLELGKDPFSWPARRPPGGPRPHLSL